MSDKEKPNNPEIKNDPATCIGGNKHRIHINTETCLDCGATVEFLSEDGKIKVTKNNQSVVLGEDDYRTDEPIRIS